MPLTFQAHPDQRQIAAAIRRVVRKRVTLIRAIAVVFALWGVVFGLFLGSGVGYLIYFWVLALILGVGCPALLVWRSTRASTRMVMRPTSYRFDANGFGISTDLTQTAMRWAAVTTVDHLPGQVLLRLSKAQFISVPTSGLTPDQRTQLETLLRTHAPPPGPPPPSAPPAAAPPHTPATAPPHTPPAGPAASPAGAMRLPGGIRPPAP